MDEIHEPSPSKKIHKEEETALEILKHVKFFIFLNIFLSINLLFKLKKINQ